MKRIHNAIAAAALALLALACQDKPVSPPGPQTGPAAPVAPVVMAGAGDIADCTNPAAQATATLLDSIPGIVFTVGDNAYPNGADADFANCYGPTWGRHKARTRPATGNHEYNTPNATSYAAYFGAAAGEPGKLYYSYAAGAWHIVVLNSSIDMGASSPQLQWLRNDLDTTTARCTAAFWHHPRFSSGANHGSDTTMQPAWQVLHDAGAEIVVSGHDHLYERFAPQTPRGQVDAAFGIREFVVGTGGGGLYQFNTPIPNSEVRSADAYGVLKLTLDTAGYAWQFVPVPGASFNDAGTGACHDAPSSSNVLPVARPGGPYTSSDGTVHFSALASSDADGDLPLSYWWDFGDGSSNDGVRPTHTYGADGTFQVTLRVSDARGGTGTPAVTTVAVQRTNTEVVLSAAGNISACYNDRDAATAALLDQLPGYVLTLGDNVFPSGTLEEYQTCYHPTWGRHRTRTFAVLGNHDYDLSAAAGAFGYFGDRAGPAGLGYYSTNIGQWHVVILNDNSTSVPYGAGSTQAQWLAADLAGNSRRCILAAWHTPLFLSSNSAGYTVNPSRKVLWDLLYAAGADVVLSANQHHYERMAPMRPDGTRDDPTGIRQFNVGTGGEGVDLPTLAIHPNSEVRAAVFGILKLSLGAASYTWEFRSTAGTTLSDTGAGSCH